MPYERLLRTGRIKAYAAKPSEIDHLLRVADRDLTTAKATLDTAPDWAYSIAYNAILQAGRALMLKEGYRSRGGEAHATVVEFIEEKLGLNFSSKVHLFDQMRRKRHRIIYEIAGLVSKSEAEQAVSFALGFVEDLRVIIKT